jgi:hypothetical protein
MITNINNILSFFIIKFSENKSDLKINFGKLAEFWMPQVKLFCHHKIFRLNNDDYKGQKDPSLSGLFLRVCGTPPQPRAKNHRALPNSNNYMQIIIALKQGQQLFVVQQFVHSVNDFCTLKPWALRQSKTNFLYQ